MAQWIACNRTAVSALDGRCRNQASENGRCTSVLAHRNGAAPPADAPHVVLVKPKLTGRALEVALTMFPAVLRVAEERFTESHELVATMAGRAFEAYRPTGDSGTPVFGKGGLMNPDVSGVPTELAEAGFSLADVHCWKREGTSHGFLVLGYRRNAETARLTPDQQRFIARSLGEMRWGKVHVWANIPEYWGEYKGKRFKFLILAEDKERGRIKVIGTKPKMDTAWWVERSDFGSIQKEVLHTVNLADHGEGAKTRLIYNNGFWGIGAQ